MEYTPTYLNAIQDPELKREYTDFVNTVPINTQLRIRPLAKRLNNLKLQDITWDLAVDTINNPITTYDPDNRKCAIYMFEFLVYLSDQNKYSGRYANELQWNRDDFFTYSKGTSPLKMENLIVSNVSPLSFIKYKISSGSDIFIILKKPTKYLATSISKFLNRNSYQKQQTIKHNTMFNYFTESLGESNPINSFSDFSDDTFFLSFKYFNEIHNYSNADDKQKFLAFYVDFTFISSKTWILKLNNKISNYWILVF